MALLAAVRTTTIKGVPRIIQHDKLSLRLLWTTGVLILLTVACTNVTLVIREYFRYPSVSFLADKNIIRMTAEEGGEALGVLDTTFCNLNPLASSVHTMAGGEAALDIPTMTQYLDMIETEVDRYRQLQADTAAFNESTLLAIDYLKSYRGYFNFLGLENATRVSHKKENFLVECYFLFYVANSPMKKIPCENSIRRVVTAEFFNCYSVGSDQLDEMDITQTGIPRGIMLVLHLDDRLDSIHQPYDTLHDNAQIAGFAFSHNLIRSVPDLWFRALNLSPGLESRIVISHKTRERLGEPHGNCLDEDTDAVALFGLQGEKMAYTTLGCLNSCTMDEIAKRCNCTEPALLATTKLETLKLRFCGTLTDDIESSIRDATCATKVKGAVDLLCARKCRPACLEVGYSQSLSGAQWPKKSQHLSFYQDVIKMHEFQDNYKVYEDIQGLLDSGNQTEAEAALEKTTLIEKNFAKVWVYSEDFAYTVKRDRSQFTSQSLVSEVGGALNLYIGISLVLVLELIELFYIIIRDAVGKKWKQKQPAL